MCNNVKIDMELSLEELTSGMSSMERHNFMYKYAEQNKAKGKKGGCCNVTQCQKQGASSFNKGMDAYYCNECFTEIYNSATYNGLKEVSWILAEDSYPDYHFPYDEVPDLIEDVMDFAENRNKQEKYIEDSERLPEYDVGAGPELFKEYKRTPWKRNQDKVKRNDPCPCGTGLKYKKCHGR